MNAGVLLASNRRLIFGGPVIALGLTGKSLFAVKWELMKPTRRPSVSLVTETGIFLWMCSPLISGGPFLSLRCSARVRHCLSEGGGLVCESVGKADLLSDHFDSKQSREAVDLPFTCHPSPSITTFAFRLSEVRRLLLDLDSCCGTNPLGMFPLFLKRTADVMAPCLSVVFRSLFVWVVSRLSGDRPMSPQFQKFHRLLPFQLQIIP